MFDKVTIHRGTSKEKFNLGLLAELMLFYQDVSLILDRGSLTLLLNTLSPDTILRLTREHGVKFSYHREMFGLLTNTINGIPANNFGAFTFGGSAKKKVVSVNQEIEETVRRVLGISSQTRKFVKEFVAHVSREVIAATDLDDLKEFAKTDLLNLKYSKYAMLDAMSHLVPSVPVDPEWRVTATDLGRAGFIMDSNIDFGFLDEEYRKVPGQEKGSLNLELLATYIFDTRAEAYFASRDMSAYVCNPIYSKLMQRKFLDLIRLREKDVRETDLFQEMLLPNGRTIAEVINSGEAKFEDILPIISNATKFKNWLNGRAANASLLNDYFNEVSSETWLQTIPGKTLRWLTTGGLCLVAGTVFSDAVGALAGLGIGAADTFLVEKLIKGWKPDQFVDGTLVPFVGGL